jgi:ribonuclease Y
VAALYSNLLALLVPAAALAGGAASYVGGRVVQSARRAQARQEAARIVEDAKREAEALRREAAVAGREEAERLRQEWQRDLREDRLELQRAEQRLAERVSGLDRRQEQVELWEREVSARAEGLGRREERLREAEEARRRALEAVSGMSREEARRALLDSLQEELAREEATLIRQSELRAREEADRRAREILAVAVQRLAAEHVSEISVATVNLPNEEMKGRIIGREGRNIRAFEAAAGVELVVDDTPGAVVVSAFDPVRREVARWALERLVADGRIHPARIEETVSRCQRDMAERLRQAGEDACFEVGIHDLDPDIVELLGRLQFRTSYGQNVLRHSVEVALLAGGMAAEMGLDVHLAKRAGLLHDIGKALSHELEGPHADVGGELLRRYGEPEAVVRAMEAHHGDVEAPSPEAFLIMAADAASAARPGARRESLEHFLTRLRKLEAIAASFPGVDKAYAIQAGREVRIAVRASEVDDIATARVARDVVRRIEREMQYPGQIKVTVIRETRWVEVAR